MPNNRNDKLDFSDLGPRVTVGANFKDARGNTWRIVAIGLQEAVNEFVEGKELLLIAEPANEPPSLPPITPMSVPPADDTPPAPKDDTPPTPKDDTPPAPKDDTPPSSKDDTPPKDDNPPILKEAAVLSHRISPSRGVPHLYSPEVDPDNPFDLPDLDVQIELIDVQVPAPYRASFLIDPKLKSHKSKSYGFKLPGDSTADETYSADHSVTVTLSSSNHSASGTGTSGSLHCSAPNNRWSISVYNNATTITTFSIGGDFKVPQ